MIGFYQLLTRLRTQVVVRSGTAPILTLQACGAFPNTRDRALQGAGRRN